MMVHGDDRGLCLPPGVAPIQVVVVPIPFKEKKEPVQQVATSVVNELTAAGLRAHLDDRDLRPGNKFYHWERRGVPVRLEIGPADIEKNQVIAVRRDTGKKQAIPRQALTTKVKQLMDEVSDDQRERAWKSFNELIREASDAKEIKHIIEKKGGIVRVPWCEKEACAKALEEQGGASILGEEFESRQASGVCPICSKRTTTSVLMAKTY